MEYKWNVASAILIALISGGVGAFTTYETTKNKINLEKLKIKSSDLAARRSYFNKRCGSMNSLYKSMTAELQNLYKNSNPSDISPVLSRIGKLRSQRLIANSYLGDSAEKVRQKYLISYKSYKKSKPHGRDPSAVEDLVPSVMGLGAELKSCNTPGSFPSAEQIFQEKK